MFCLRLTSLFLVCLFFFSFALANDVNLYQTCSRAGIRYSSPYWGYPPSYGTDAGNLALPPSDHYSYTLDDGTMVYFNVCAGSTICDGGLACTVSPNGFKTIYAYPTSAPDYYSSYSSPQSTVLSYHIHAPEYRSVEIYISCDYNFSASNQVTSVTFDDDDDLEYMNIYMTSYDVCATSEVSLFTNPRNYTSLTAPFFMAGDLPMFSMDSVSLASDTTSFVGTVYYSSLANSFRMDGTLSNGAGNSSDVSYLYSGNQPLDNPPVIVARVNLPGKNGPSCVLLPNPLDADDDDYEVDWFSASSSQNSFQSVSRNYTSVYFEKGTTMPVNVYTAGQYDYFVTLMESQYGGPIFVGIEALAPFLGYQGESPPPMISEFNWNNVNTTPLESSMFDVPADWNCKK